MFVLYNNNLHIYIHIPFCKQACNYCDFHFSTSLKNKDAFLNALKKEIFLRKDYLPLNPPTKGRDFFPLSIGEGLGVRSIYFGGGTPSLLSQKEILEIFAQLNKYFSIEENAEITLEANPDDLTKEKISALKETPVNRLSIGIQSFSEDDLKFMNRAHNVKQAIDSVKMAQDAGFGNISIDLIYGTPTLSNEQWKKNLDIAFSMNVPHISAYCLTVEPKTAMAGFIKKGKIKNVDEEKSAQQFEILMEEMEKNNFIQYEISNFCKPTVLKSPSLWEGWGGLHNISYWQGAHYLGLGPSAHSYNGNSRQWNVANNNLYIKSLEKNELNFEKEILTRENKFNEYVLTSLRTIWGCNLNEVKKNFGQQYAAHLIKNAEPYFQKNQVFQKKNILTLSRSGKFFADRIISDLFV